MKTEIEHCKHYDPIKEVRLKSCKALCCGYDMKLNSCAKRLRDCLNRKSNNKYHSVCEYYED